MSGDQNELAKIKHVFVCEAKFGIEILDEIYWGFPPHQYGYFVGEQQDILTATPDFFSKLTYRVDSALNSNALTLASRLNVHSW